MEVKKGRPFSELEEMIEKRKALENEIDKINIELIQIMMFHGKNMTPNFNKDTTTIGILITWAANGYFPDDVSPEQIALAKKVIETGLAPSQM